MRLAFNPAPMDASAAALPLDALDLLVVNETEARGLAALARRGGRAPDDALAAGAALAARLPGVPVVVTLGARGAALLRGDERVEAAAPRVEAVDTTGAGDTFVGYLLAALAAGSEPAAALGRACAAGALATTRAGATPSIPSAADVDAAVAAAETPR